MYGECGEDYLYGRTGDDYLSGSAGNDYIHGIEGRDVLNGGAGAGDRCEGGTEMDSFESNPPCGCEDAVRVP